MLPFDRDMLKDDVEFDDHSAYSLWHLPKKRKCDKLLACFLLWKVAEDEDATTSITYGQQ